MQKSRVRPIFSMVDSPDYSNALEHQELQQLFDSLFPNQTAPSFDDSHTGMAIAAKSPKLALQLSCLSRTLALELPWSQRADLRELAILAVNVCQRCDYGFNSRKNIALAQGMSNEQLDALWQWRHNADLTLFDTEQQLVIRFSYAVINNTVSDELFTQATTRYGETGVVEMTSVIGFWAFWAMFLNTLYPVQ